jgi:hypothetical protein
MPAFTLLFARIKSIIRISIYLFLRKSFIHFTRISGILLFLRLWICLLYETLSNMLAISRLSSEATLSLLPAYIIYIFSIKRCSVIFINCCFRTPIYISGSRVYVSTTYRISFAIIVSTIFSNIFNNVISLYANELI